MGRSPAVTVHAHDLAQVDLALKPPDRPPGGRELADVRPLVLEVVELEHQRIGLRAADARVAGEVLVHEATGRQAAPRACIGGLCPVTATPVRKVLRKAASTPMLPAGGRVAAEVRDRQRALAAPTALYLAGCDRASADRLARARARGRLRRRTGNVPDPDADRCD